MGRCGAWREPKILLASKPHRARRAGCVHVAALNRFDLFATMALRSSDRLTPTERRDLDRALQTMALFGSIRLVEVLSLPL